MSKGQDVFTPVFFLISTGIRTSPAIQLICKSVNDKENNKNVNNKMFAKRNALTQTGSQLRKPKGPSQKNPFPSESYM